MEDRIKAIEDRAKGTEQNTDVRLTEVERKIERLEFIVNELKAFHKDDGK